MLLLISNNEKYRISLTLHNKCHLWFVSNVNGSIEIRYLFGFILDSLLKLFRLFLWCSNPWKRFELI